MLVTWTARACWSSRLVGCRRRVGWGSLDCLLVVCCFGVVSFLVASATFDLVLKAGGWVGRCTGGDGSLARCRFIFLVGIDIVGVDLAGSCFVVGATTLGV